MHTPTIRDSPSELENKFALETTISQQPLFVSFMVTYEVDGRISGMGDFDYFPNSAILKWGTFYPYARAPHLKGRCGLGTLAHIRTLCAAVEEMDLPEETVVLHHPEETSKDRRAHLRAMDIDHTERLRFDDYFERSFLYARRKGFRLDCVR